MVHCYHLEVSYAKKDLRNGFFRRFCVDPCGVNVFLTNISMAKTLYQKNLNIIEANQGFGLGFA